MRESSFFGTGIWTLAVGLPCSCWSQYNGVLWCKALEWRAESLPVLCTQCPLPVPRQWALRAQDREHEEEGEQPTWRNGEKLTKDWDWEKGLGHTDCQWDREAQRIWGGRTDMLELEAEDKTAHGTEPTGLSHVGGISQSGHSPASIPACTLLAWECADKDSSGQTHGLPQDLLIPEWPYQHASELGLVRQVVGASQWPRWRRLLDLVLTCPLSLTVP